MTTNEAMKRATPSNVEGGLRERVMMGGICLLESLIIVVVLGLYRMGAKPSAAAFLQSSWGVACTAALIGAMLIVAMVGKACYQEWRSCSKRWVLVIMMNVIMVASLVCLAEVLLRVGAQQKVLGEELAGRLFYPRQWERVVSFYQEVIRKAQSQPTYSVPDETLGWTVGPSRTSENGLYVSSAEGLRAAKQGVALRDNAVGCRIAVVGDSYTFGEYVAYENTWAYLLEKALDSRCQVLNFGVGGYGVDQMYLRYLKDIRSWKPDIVVLSFINHDVIRTLAIYSFLLFPDGAMPFSKPRFVLRDGSLTVLNRPLIGAGDMFERKSIRELPFIEYDIDYHATEWDRPAWATLYKSYLFRFLISVHPLYEPERQEISTDEIEAINREIFRSFVKDLEADGAVPIVAYLPTEGEIPKPWWEPIGLKILREANIPGLDLRDCLNIYDSETILRPTKVGGHYSEEGNKRVADCFLEPIQEQLNLRLQRSN